MFKIRTKSLRFTVCSVSVTVCYMLRYVTVCYGNSVSNGNGNGNGNSVTVLRYVTVCSMSVTVCYGMLRYECYGMFYVL